MGSSCYAGSPAPASSAGASSCASSSTRNKSCLLVAGSDRRRAGWQELRDPASGRIYYVNASTGQSRWDRP
eukprot:748003-Hanusia_phi.AAC.1